MGGRVHLPLALSAALLATGCVDFAEPVFPNAGAPALVSLSASLLEQGLLSVNARVQPGRDSAGVTRLPLDSTIFVLGLAVEADTVEARNTLVFSELVPIGRESLAGPVTIVAPPIAGIQAAPPEVRWFGLVKVGPDTVSVVRGTDLVLRVQARLGEALPAVQVRQWFLDLTGTAGSFRVSGTGYPPDTLRIPPQWVPVDSVGTVHASLIYYQSATLRPPPGDYIGNIALDARLQWQIQVR